MQCAKVTRKIKLIFIYPVSHKIPLYDVCKLLSPCWDIYFKDFIRRDIFLISYDKYSIITSYFIRDNVFVLMM